MPNAYDQKALTAVAEVLADAAHIHRKASKVADDADLSRSLSDRRDKLKELSELANPSGEVSDGSMMRLLDQFRLAVDAVFGDDDEAAAIASKEAKRQVVAVTESYLNSPELSAGTKNILQEVHHRVTGGRIAFTRSDGLTGLPT